MRKHRRYQAIEQYLNNNNKQYNLHRFRYHTFDNMNEISL